MANFFYHALNSQGTELRGQLQAENLDMAIQELRLQGLRVIEINPGRKTNGFLGQENFSDWLASQQSVSHAALIFFFRQMTFMLRAGLPITQALELAKTQMSSPRLNLTLKLMLKDIESGQALSVSMKKHPMVFSDMMVNLMMAGETTGDLSTIMERLAIHLDKKAALRAQMINAMIYPCIVILATIFVGIFMVVKIIPKFSKFLLGQGKALPPSTQMLIEISDFVRANGLTIIGIIIALIIALLFFYQTRLGRFTIDSFMLRLPVIGNLLVNGSIAQIAWALSILLRSGVTVFDAMKVTANLLGNQVYSNQLIACSNSILQGKDISQGFRHPRIPALVIQMIAVGESTGNLDDVLLELGIYYESLLAIAIKRLSAMIEPMMILVIGSMVGFVYYAFFQALFSLVG